MRTNHTKQKLQLGRPTLGTWLSLGSLHVARELARSGFDWLTLDVEHYAYDWRQIEALVAAIADSNCNCAPLIRVPDGSHTWIKRALDCGAFGIVVPMVETIEQARTAIAAAKYPPLGNRSVGGGMHYLNFDCSVDEYYQAANDEILIVLQTESLQGIRNAHEIYSLPGVDAIFVGPNDLRFGMRDDQGVMPQPHRVEAQIQKVVDTGQQLGTPTGMHVFSTRDAAQRMEQGMQFLAVSSDLRFLTAQVRQTTQELGLSPNTQSTIY